MLVVGLVLTHDALFDNAEAGHRIRVDQEAAVTTPVNAYPEPAVGATAVARLTPGDEVYVIGGPKRNNGQRWWQIVLASGDVGWVPEGFLEPAPTG